MTWLNSENIDLLKRIPGTSPTRPNGLEMATENTLGKTCSQREYDY